jgi:hypothetical protein
MDFELKTKPKTVETLNHDELCELILAAIKVSGNQNPVAALQYIVLALHCMGKDVEMVFKLVIPKNTRVKIDLPIKTDDLGPGDLGYYVVWGNGKTTHNWCSHEYYSNRTMEYTVRIFGLNIVGFGDNKEKTFSFNEFNFASMSKGFWTHDAHRYYKCWDNNRYTHSQLANKVIESTIRLYIMREKSRHKLNLNYRDCVTKIISLGNFGEQCKSLEHAFCNCENLVWDNNMPMPQSITKTNNMFGSDSCGLYYGASYSRMELEKFQILSSYVEGFVSKIGDSTMFKEFAEFVARHYEMKYGGDFGYDEYDIAMSKFMLEKEQFHQNRYICEEKRTNDMSKSEIEKKCFWDV